jgi:hypothetical protein
VPGLQLAGTARDHAGCTGTAVAVVLGDARFELVVDPHTGALLETRRILLRHSNQFPGMTPGLISRATFLQSDVSSGSAEARLDPIDGEPREVGGGEAVGGRGADGAALADTGS